MCPLTGKSEWARASIAPVVPRSVVRLIVDAARMEDPSVR